MYDAGGEIECESAAKARGRSRTCSAHTRRLQDMPLPGQCLTSPNLPCNAGGNHPCKVGKSKRQDAGVVLGHDHGRFNYKRWCQVVIFTNSIQFS